MILKVFAVYDAKAECFSTPFFQATLGLAIRGFKDAANDANSAVGRHPADYTLFELGTFDDSNGQYVESKVHTPHGKALDYVEHQTDFLHKLGEEEVEELRTNGQS